MKDNIFNYQQNNEAQILAYDNRQFVKDSTIHPYNAIGRITSQFYGQKKNQFIEQSGIGCIIGQNLVITSAHVIYNSDKKAFADKILFYPADKDSQTVQNAKKYIKVVKFYLNIKYTDSSYQKRSLLDFVILKLQPNLILKKSQILKLKFNYNYESSKQKQIMLCGYTGKLKDNKFRQLFEQRQAQSQNSGFLNYKHTTQFGNSGGPILIRQKQRYEVIGIHKGFYYQHNYGILIQAIQQMNDSFKRCIDENSFSKDWTQFKINNDTSNSNSNSLFNTYQNTSIQKQKKNTRVLEQKLIKFCVVGEPSVGKTSMLFQYVHHMFDQKVKPTVGCDFSTKLKSNIDGTPIRLQLWDIAGQERFNSVSKMYLRGALGCLIVCSSIQPSTIQQTLNWKKIIEGNQNNGIQTKIPCLLVQNKSDLIIPDSMEEYQKKIYLDKFAYQNGFCGSIQCSAKTNINIEQVFQFLVDETIKRGLIKENSITQRELVKKTDNNIKLTNQKQNVEQKKKKKCC